ncbi:hypothetical protein [Burkholderia sp. LAS2]|uniref:hypothetical protein n=1 Tax=Burkholderia sp. LAS2 TaxID=2813843 RepID=UPI00201B4984|nr:hypothetical protein [Burkholderia sp. LAS2]
MKIEVAGIDGKTLEKPTHEIVCFVAGLAKILPKPRGDEQWRRFAKPYLYSDEDLDLIPTHVFHQNTLPSGLKGGCSRRIAPCIRGLLSPPAQTGVSR